LRPLHATLHATRHSDWLQTQKAAMIGPVIVMHGRIVTDTAEWLYL